MLTSEDFAKKNAKDKFFKKEITNLLKRMKEDKEIIDKKNNLNKFFEGQFSFIKSFDFNQ
jgi:Txe/YoeB family toxin of Txe-Axe toxin-antitoxin module